MGIFDDLTKDVSDIFNLDFSVRDGRKVPSAENVTLGNDAVKLDATILYADMNGSTDLVDNFKWWFAAKIYKSYLHCACKIIRSEGGEIVAFDGDRVMAMFIGDSKNSTAARTALKINYVTKIVNDEISTKYPNATFSLKQCCGIDTSEVKAVRTGIRGSNDLVWVGHSANYAAKLTAEGGGYSSYITTDVYDVLGKDSKFGANGSNMWTRVYSNQIKKYVYKSNWRWKP
jgi:class 3 adenylate cyclase